MPKHLEAVWGVLVYRVWDDTEAPSKQGGLELGRPRTHTTLYFLQKRFFVQKPVLCYFSFALDRPSK